MALVLQFLLPACIGIVLIFSGIQKLKTMPATVASFRAFRLPSVLQTKIFATAFSIFEIVLGIAVIVTSGRLLQISGLIATGLFLAFSVLVANVVIRKEIVDCNCFGAWSTKPVSLLTLLRNLALSVGALSISTGLINLGGAISAVLAFSVNDYFWLGLVTLCLAAMAAQRFRQASTENFTAPGSFGTDVPDLSGKPIPEGELRNGSDTVVKLTELARERAQLLIFAKPGCNACGPVMASLDEWRSKLGESVHIRVVTTHNLESLGETYPREQATALRDGSSMMATILSIPGVPSAILLGTNGSVGAGPAVGPDATISLAQAVIDTLEIV